MDYINLLSNKFTKNWKESQVKKGCKTKSKKEKTRIK